jgi:acyl carrier protein
MLDEVRAAFARELHIPTESIGADSTIESLPDLDSARLLRVISALEDQFGVGIDDDLIYNSRTVGELARLFADDAHSAESEHFRESATSVSAPAAKAAREEA